MWELLTFRHFITPDILIIAYYTGALIMPLLLWRMHRYLTENIALFSRIDASRKHLFKLIDPGKKVLIIALLVILFVMMELMWRMMFEAMIGYFQMHDYLQALSNGVIPPP